LNNIDSIAIQESGGNQTAKVIFQVVDVFGAPIDKQDVNFELTTNVGGVTLQDDLDQTDVDGKARAIVQAGFIPTTVRVRASVEISPGTTLVTLSDALSVNTGVADQNSMSMSASSLNIEGESIDGNTTSITVRMADAFNNPVPDGTSIQFRTEYGSIQPQCTTSSGACSVNLTSQEPRRPLDPNTTVRSLISADESCPADLIKDESVTIAGTDGDTEYQVSSIHRVETTTDVALALTTDYTVDADGTGITCAFGSATCTDTTTLRITYDRAWMDEDDDASTAHIISDPGVATAPFESRSVWSNVPCRAASRVATDDAPAYLGGFGQVYGGRSTVLAFAQGEESFIDSNGNGLYDFDEPFVDLPEAFIDYNEDGVFGNPGTIGSSNNVTNECYGPDSPVTNPGQTLNRCFQEGGEEEEFVDFGLEPLNNQFDAGNGIYNGTLCRKEISDRTSVCDNNAAPCNEGTDQWCTRELVNIRRQLPILFAGSSAAIQFRDSSTGEIISGVNINGSIGNGRFNAVGAQTQNNGVAAAAAFSVGHGNTEVAPGVGETDFLTSGNGGVVVDIADIFNGVLPSSTTISVTSGTDGCVIQNSPGTTVGNTSGTGFSQIFISLAQPTLPGGGAPITVTVTTPSGTTSQRSISCTH
jgi:hypothetical protein